MTGLDSLIRRWFPRRYCIRGLRRAEDAHKRQLKAAVSADERYKLKRQLENDVWEWTDWLREIDDKRLIAKAAKRDIDLDDIPLPQQQPDERPSHYELGTFGNRYLADETRKAIKAKMREKAPAYRKERREFLDLIIKALPFVTGLIGTAIGLVAAIKK
jgi:hypothetical protein